MGSGHHHHHRSENTNSHRAIGGALAVTVGFMGVEFVVGWWANSLALATDAVHMLADSGGLLVAAGALWISRKPSTPRMSYGYQRAEILGALLSGLAIWFLSGLLIFEAFQRIHSPPEVKGPWVAVTALLGLFVNLASLKFLHGAKDESMNVRAAYLHVMGDLLGSVGALLSGIIIWATGWYLADPLVTFLFAALVLYHAWKLVREAVDVLMEAAPRGVDPEGVHGDLAGLGGVAQVHDLHIWSLSSGRSALSVHLVSARGDEVLGEANRLLKEKHGIEHTTIQVEHPDRADPDHCTDC